MPSRKMLLIRRSCFLYKGGLHASAIGKPSTYEHIIAVIGNSRNVVISNQAGRSNILNQLNKINIDIPKKN